MVVVSVIGSCAISGAGCRHGQDAAGRCSSRRAVPSFATRRRRVCSTAFATPRRPPAISPYRSARPTSAALAPIATAATMSAPDVVPLSTNSSTRSSRPSRTAGTSYNQRRGTIELASPVRGQDHRVRSRRCRSLSVGDRQNALDDELALPAIAQPFHVVGGGPGIETCYR